jgi:Tol biopolymer transport system component
MPPVTEIHIADANGCNDQVILTGTFSVEPRWSVKDRIVFMSLMNGSALDAYTMNTKGQDLLRLTNNQGNTGDPVWSPDGSKISFGSDREGGGKLNIFVMSADGSNPVQLTHVDVPYETGDTHWSSDGSTIAFEYDTNGMKQSDPTALAEVWTMNADGSGQLSTGQRCSGVGCSPRFAPTR